METAKSKSRVPRAQSPEQVLESYYSQFLTWGSLLTRGDEAMAREIVHDLCLHFALAKPDLSHVENLDGYLYTSLRHIYLSTLGQASRDAAKLIGIAEHDSVYFALRSGSPDSLLQRQNDLRRVCNYLTWRKESAKGASYLTLLFFHGYTRSEIAAIASVPLAAVYNKLKIVRDELKEHLLHSNGLTVVRRDAPPDAKLRVAPVAFADLFDELRARILSAKATECLTEDNLLAHYRTEAPRPVPCSLLAHIVSCERCLSLLDQHFDRPTLADREPPIDFNRSPWGDRDRALMHSLRWHREKIYEHRPESLSIAVNGRITASHDVQGERSTLSSRIENPKDAQFVEVFSERFRLALLPVGEGPPDGLHSQMQRIALSDDRWLQLTLTFDGLGLQTEVTYVDPALSGAALDQDIEDVPLSSTPETIGALPSRANGSSRRSRFGEFLRAITRGPGLAWCGTILAVATIGGLLAYRWLASQSNPDELLAQSIQAEAVDLVGQAEHQSLRVEEIAADGQVLFQGEVDAWKDGAGRRMRRLYDSDKRLVAAEWQLGKDRGGSYLAPETENLPVRVREFAASPLWRADMSALAFKLISSRQLTMRRVNSNYEISSDAGNDELHLTSATLVLNGKLHAVGEILRIQTGSGRNTVRLVQTDYERRPAASMPADAFDLPNFERHSTREGESPTRSRSFGALEPAARIRLVQLHIAVLNQLNTLGADVGDPLEVKRTPAERIRISGTVQDAARKSQVMSALEALPDHDRLEIAILSPQDIHMPRASGRLRMPTSASVYSFENDQAPADAMIQKHFSQMGMSSDRVSTLSTQFSRDVLGHAQRALQQAYALDRLGGQFSTNELREAGAGSQHLWVGMAASHASGLRRELRELRQQLAELAPGSLADVPSGDISGELQSPAQFAGAVHGLLKQTQLLNARIGLAFTSAAGRGPKPDAASLVRETGQSIPLDEAENLNAFTERLASDETNRAFAAKHNPKSQAPR